jgi:hypothetical protein
MSAQQQIEKLRTIQESMHKIADKVVSLGDGSVMLNDVAEGKKQIADAINIKGGNSTPNESFQQFASDIQTLPYAGISAKGIVQTKPFSFVQYLTNDINSSITELNTSEITNISRGYAFYKNITLSKISLPNLATISGVSTFYGCSSLQSVELPNLSTISGRETFFGCSSLQSVELPNLATISGASTFSSCSSLQSVEFGRLILIIDSFNNKKENLRNITIGQGTNINLPFQYWTATNVIAEGQSGIDELNSNLRTNLLEKLADHSTDGQTRTLRLGWLAYVTQENIDYANSKGWTLTT